MIMVKITVTVKKEVDGLTLEKTISKEIDLITMRPEIVNMEIQNLFKQIEKSGK